MGSLHDAYELGGIAGEGRTTKVRLGVRRGDCLLVALKQLRDEHLDDADRRARFIEQARRAGMLSHHAIERVLDVLHDQGRPVIVAEWIDGRSLHGLAASLRRGGLSWPPQVVSLIARRLLQALRHAHCPPTSIDGAGIPHGSISPRNVLVDIDGEVKVVDFGLASVLQEAPEPWQSLEAMRYLSADHVRYGASPAADLYAVGAIVHELLSGQRFRARCETEADMRAAIDSLEPLDPPRADVPEPLEQLRRRLLEPATNARLTIEHMLDLCEAVPLDRAQSELRALVRRVVNDRAAEPEPQPEPEPEPQPDGRIARARLRGEALVHAAAIGELEPLPLGHAASRSVAPEIRDTQSVPVPHDHEQTAPRRPRFLQQTAPPASDQARDAEQRRSGGDDDGASPHAVLEVDTAPIETEPGAPQAELSLSPSSVPIGGDPLHDLDVTAEVVRAPSLPEDRMPDRARPQGAARRSPASLRGPLGWALVGALVAGVGLPLLARCRMGNEPDANPGTSTKTPGDDRSDDRSKE